MSQILCLCDLDLVILKQTDRHTDGTENITSSANAGVKMIYKFSNQVQINCERVNMTEIMRVIEKNRKNAVCCKDLAFFIVENAMIQIL